MLDGDGTATANGTDSPPCTSRQFETARCSLPTNSAACPKNLEPLTACLVGLVAFQKQVVGGAHTGSVLCPVLAGVQPRSKARVCGAYSVLSTEYLGQKQLKWAGHQGLPGPRCENNIQAPAR